MPQRRPSLPCPSCGFITLDQGYGSYDICPVCGWEDDGVQLANPTSEGGANKDSLATHQQRALQLALANRDVFRGFRRDRRWRPLTPAEIRYFDDLKVRSHWHTPAVLTDAEAYWSRG
jgi:hypothetical protein